MNHLSNENQFVSVKLLESTWAEDEGWIPDLLVRFSLILFYFI